MSLKNNFGISLSKLPISVMIVGYNEGKFLSGCFKSIEFCNEIVYTDLGSTDSSVSIARQYTSNIYTRGRVPSCEMIQAEVVNYLKNDWVIFIDPDEFVDETLSIMIQKEFKFITSDDKVGAVTVPWQFYFRNRKLRGTVWGGENYKYFLVNKNRFEFLPIVHYGRKLKPGFSSVSIELNRTKTNLLHHYWMNSHHIFIKKHLRYLKNEGIDNYNLGIRSSLKKILFSPFKEFYFSYVTKNGYRDLFVGAFLSAFWAFYKTYIMIDIYFIQRKKENQPILN